MQGPTMATTGKKREYGRDRHGHWRPGFMTHAELVAELETATGGRRDELVTEAEIRMQVTTYPSFPAHLGLAKPDPLLEVLSEPRNAERADAGTARQSGNP
jgi:hypothetical protein